MMLDYNQIKELIKEIDSSSLRVFELENSDIKLKLSKNTEKFSCKEEKSTIEGQNLAKSYTNHISNEIETIKDLTVNKQEEIKVENFKVVKSPLVGTYYSSSTPGGKSYVEVGSIVKKGDVLCIVEAMKIMNEITSEFEGEVVEILGSDEEIVEFGMELFKIR